MSGARWWFDATFWFCALWCVYVYALYPVLLANAYALVQLRRDWRYLARRGERRTRELGPERLPAVSIIIPVHNEATALPEKLTNLAGLDYPADRVELIFVSDGSDDGSNEMLRARATGHRLLILPHAGGKSNALNHGVELASHEILVLCDAATLLAPDAVRKLVRHFQRPKVGVVCGALQFRGNGESMRTEGLYWRYESLLRLMEGRLGATLTASGALYALRRECYLPLDPKALIDDFVIPMNARARGFTVEYDPEATALDFAAESIEGEFTRRVRLAVGSFRALGALLRVPLPACARWAFLSHKVGRWLLPFVLLALLAASLVLTAHPGPGAPIYRLALVAQGAFYGWALVGMALRRRRIELRSAGFAYYLLAMNAAFVVGLLLLWFRHGETKWQQTV